MELPAKTILVICDSDIILSGLSDILSTCRSEGLILIRRPEQLADYPHLLGYILLILPSEISADLIRERLPNAVDIKYLLLNLRSSGESGAERIALDDSRRLIAEKVNQLLDSFGSPEGEDSRNELSPRETDVLQLVAKGLSNKEIADKLSISTHTVISHRKNISEKTGIRSASGLTMYAVIKKIIDIDEISTSDLI
jgi:DNA-binding CsgD family transcriptional regulator